MLTVEELRRVGQDGARWASAASRTRCAPCPREPALDAATRDVRRRREAFRQLLVDALDAQQLDALLYPANQARPHTHEGGAERYGTEPGTCEESAATGLPQVTVPAGYLGGRYPVGISFLGRMWDDRRLLATRARVRTGDEAPTAAFDGQVTGLGARGWGLGRADPPAHRPQNCL